MKRYKKVLPPKKMEKSIKNKTAVKKITKVLSSGAVSMLMLTTVAFPVNATPLDDPFSVSTAEFEDYKRSAPQAFTTESYELEFDDSLLHVESEVSKEWLAEQARIKAEKEAKEKAEREAAEAAARASYNSEQSDRPIVDVPPGAGAEGLVAAAKAQIGVAQDCTDLVQRSLAAIGLTETRENGGYDLGTGIWQYDSFGSRVDITKLAPGDILIYGNASSGAHVSIYIGDGLAVHGGYNGNTVIADAHSAYQPLTGAIRVR